MLIHEWCFAMVIPAADTRVRSGGSHIGKRPQLGLQNFALEHYPGMNAVTW